jgi:NitT/TauT family transport system permease protein
MTAIADDAGELGPGRETRRRRLYLDNRSFIRGTLGIVAVLVAWELFARIWMNGSISVAPPSDVFHEYVRLSRNGQLWRDVKTSGQEFLLGYVLALVLGVSIGLLMGGINAVRDYLDPLVSALYATPVIGLAPLFIIWFGIGINSKIAVVFLLAILPIVINTESGIRTVDPHLVETARAFSARRSQIFLKVLLPGALPQIVTGLRLGVGRGLRGVVAGELFAAQAGLGYLIVASSQLFNPAGVFVGITALAFAGILSMVLLRRLERRLAPWRTESGS